MYLFGYGVICDNESDIAQHVGVITHWNEESPYDSLVAHYGVGNTPVVLVETLRDVHNRCIKLYGDKYTHIYLNDKMVPAHMENFAAKLDDGGKLRVGIKLEYEAAHQSYNLATSSCQTFAKYMLEVDALTQSDELHLLYDVIKFMLDSKYRAYFLAVVLGISLIIGRKFNDIGNFIKRNTWCRWTHRISFTDGVEILCGEKN